MTNIFDNHGCVKVVPMETKKYGAVADRKIKHTADELIMNDREVINFCLNCTKVTCRYGTCLELEDFISAKKAKR